MQPNLKPETVEAMRQLVDHSRALTKALAALANQGSREFKEHPGGEYIDRSQAMEHVIAIRDAHYRLCDCARQSLIAPGVRGTRKCLYCSADMIVGSECTSASQASGCETYERNAATHGVVVPAEGQPDA